MPKNVKNVSQTQFTPSQSQPQRKRLFNELSSALLGDWKAFLFVSSRSCSSVMRTFASFVVHFFTVVSGNNEEKLFCSPRNKFHAIVELSLQDAKKKQKMFVYLVKA
jgi:hypothetical protein